MRLKVALLAFAVASFAAIPLQADDAYPSRRPKHDPIRLSEKHELEVTYLGMPGILLELEVLPYERVGHRKAYHVRGKAVNSTALGLFFKLQDQVDSWFDFDGLFSYRLQLKQEQSDIERESTETHDPLRSETHFVNHWRRKKDSADAAQTMDKTFPIPAHFAQDSLSAFYYLRTLALKSGDTYKIPVISEGEQMDVLATVLRRESLETNRRRYPAVVIRLEKLDPKGAPIPANNYVWLSDDSQHILLRTEVGTRFGRIVASLKKFSPGQGESN